MVNIKRLSIFILLLFLFAYNIHAEENPELKILISGIEQKSISLEEMKKSLKQYKITLIDPYYKKEKKYKAFKLKEFLNIT